MDLCCWNLRILTSQLSIQDQCLVFKMPGLMYVSMNACERFKVGFDKFLESISQYELELNKRIGKNLGKMSLEDL